MTAVKICGVCSPADASLVAELGADYIGVILAPNRSRTRSEAEARVIYDAAPGVRRVGVFVDGAADAVRRTAERLRLDVVQLHGHESVDDIGALRAAGRAVWKAVPVRTAADVERAIAAFRDVADALLLDGWSPHGAGGTGTGFHWQHIAPLRAHWPDALGLVAAGGLTPDNVQHAIATLRPDIVDVSSGVEAELCVKSPDRLKDFIAAARAASEQIAG